MDKPKATRILIMCFFIIFLSSILINEEKDEIKTTSLSQRVKRISSSYGKKTTTLFYQLQTYLFPPNLDFRGRDPGGANEGGGMGEKVKEAVGKSLEKSKATVEGTAKSVAKKVKKSLSHEREPDASEEL
ncbi:uncharacterized protein LOC132283893 [Cornus florida]|uniref:uncharacterized protein LOC132283893 n=1 Tax=Cornus florida TaxID=4283 RepID=UPI0028A00A36|nr:uncharacterized protein LOC132283893 [Cornus florida]